MPLSRSIPTKKPVKRRPMEMFRIPFIAFFIFTTSAGQFMDTFMNRTIAVCPGASCQGECFVGRAEDRSCHCDEICQLYSDCCYDFWSHCKNQSHYEPPVEDLLADRLSCRSISGHRCQVSVKLISYCPDTYPEGPTKKRCVFNSLESLAPVFGKHDHLYKNKFCAECGGESASDLMYLPGGLKCPDDNETKALLENLTIADQETWNEIQQRCKREISIPDNLEHLIRYCSSSLYYTPSCQFNPKILYSRAEFEMVRLGCYSYQGFVSSTYSFSENGYTWYSDSYKNSHCAICEGVDPAVHNVTCAVGKKRRKRQVCYTGPSVINGPSFSVLLDFGRDFETTKVKALRICPDDSILDVVTDTCSTIICPPSYRLSEGVCRPISQSLTNSGYQLAAVISVSSIQGNQSINPIAKEELKFLLISNDLENYTTKSQLVNNSLTIQLISDFNNTVFTSENVTKLLRFFVACIQKMISFKESPNDFTFNMVIPNNRTCELKEFSEEILIGRRELETALLSDLVDDSDVTGGLDVTVAFEMPVYGNFSASYGKWAIERCASQTPLCHLVPIASSHVIEINETHMKLPSGEILEEGVFIESENQVFICEEHFKDISPLKSQVFTVPAATDPVQSYITVIGLSLSVGGLSLTLIVYLTLQQLQTVPGRILMNLVISLLLAQFFFLFGVGKIQWQVFCLVNAVLEHYLWLVSFFWMNVISLDLAKTFVTSTIQSHDDRGRSLFIRYNIYAWCLPLALVGACCVLDFFDVVSDTKLRYGSDIACFLAGFEGLLYAFVLPVAVILVVNLICFLGVLIILMKASALEKKIQTTRIKKNQLFLFAKLLPITGLTWIFGIIASFSNLPFLWNIFIVFNSLQGVFVFFAFVCNGRVKKLLKTKLSYMSSDGSVTNNTRA